MLLVQCNADVRFEFGDHSCRDGSSREPGRLPSAGRRLTVAPGLRRRGGRNAWDLLRLLSAHTEIVLCANHIDVFYTTVRRKDNHKEEGNYNSNRAMKCPILVHKD